MTHKESNQAKLPPGFYLGSAYDGSRGRTWFVENKQTEKYVVCFQKTPAKAVELALKLIADGGGESKT